MTQTPVFVYALTSSRDGGRLPWYVGQSTDVDARLKVHLRDAYKDPQVMRTRHSAWIRQERDASFQISVRILEECSGEVEADAREMSWIQKLRAVNPGLTNRTRGNHKNHQARLEKVAANLRRRLEADRKWLEELTSRQ